MSLKSGDQLKWGGVEVLELPRGTVSPNHGEISRKVKSFSRFRSFPKNGFYKISQFQIILYGVMHSHSFK